MAEGELEQSRGESLGYTQASQMRPLPEVFRSQPAMAGASAQEMNMMAAVIMGRLGPDTLAFQ